MIDGYFHVELGGIKYRLAEDYEGQHYQRTGSPLRPPNAQLVSGTNDLFQARPDLLIHRWDNWSGGEGLFKYSREETERYWRGRNVDGFSDAGLVKPGPHMVEVTPNNALDEPGELVRLGNTLYLYDLVDNTFHAFNDAGPSWGATAFTFTLPDATELAMPVGDSFAVYGASTSGTDFSVFRHDGTTQTTVSTTFSPLDTTAANQAGVLEVVGNYLYLVEMDKTGGGTQVWEISKNPASPPSNPTLIYDLSDSANDYPVTRSSGFTPCVTAGPQALYFFVTNGDATHVHKVNPTNAFSTGYGQEVAVIPGLNAEAMWYHSGYLYLVGRAGSSDGDPDPKRMLMYIDLQGAYGLISSEINSSSGKTSAASESSGLTKARMLIPEEDQTDFLSIIELDTRVGAIQHLAEIDLTSSSDADADFTTPFSFNDRIVVGAANGAGGTDQTYMTDPTTPMHGENCYVDSPWVDMGSTKTKLLSSFAVEFAETWAGNPWTISLYYRTEVDGAWTLIDSTTSGASLLWTGQISDSATSVEYQKIQYRLQFFAAGSTAVWPAVTSIQFQSQMTEKFDSWNLLLECTDEDAQAQSRNLRGRDQIDNVQALGSTRTPTAFLDGYTDRDPAQSDSYDVVVDEYTLILERPGEGVALVRLVEVA